MPFTVIQSGTTLQFVDTSGNLSNLTLPPGVTLSQDVPPRFTLYNDKVVLANTPTRPLIIDGGGNVYPLTPAAPTTAPIIAAGSSGGLTGTYSGVRYTFVIKDSVGNTIAESDFSPPSNAVTITAQQLSVTNVGVSTENISARRLYRPTSNGAVLFPWIEIDGNTVTTVSDDLADAGLSLVGAPILGEPPRLRTIAQFRGRLFGVGDVDLEDLRYTEAGVPYSWPASNILVIPPTGSDSFGVWASIPRRDALGIARRNTFVQITGTGAQNSDGTIDLDVVVQNQTMGVESQETVQVYRDVAYFLWKDGVYSWSTAGFQCISDLGGVRKWFTTDDYFNRQMFQYAFATLDINRNIYRLFLASAGSTVIDHWVDFYINDNKWLGPHKTDLFSPKSAFELVNAQNQTLPMIGGPVAAYQEQSTRTDGASTPINFDVLCKKFDMAMPNRHKVFGHVTTFVTSVGTGFLTVLSRISDDRNGVITQTQYADLSKGNQRLGRLGEGNSVELEYQQATAGTDVQLLGYEIDPITYVGWRR